MNNSVARVIQKGFTRRSHSSLPYSQSEDKLWHRQGKADFPMEFPSHLKKELFEKPDRGKSLGKTRKKMKGKEKRTVCP